MLQRLPRYSRIIDFPSIRIGRTRSQLLMALARFGYLSAEQLTNLLYSPASLKTIREHLKNLYQAEYVERLYLPSQVAYGSPLAIYVLDTKGGRYTETVPPDKEVGIYFLKHTLAANQLIVLSQLLKREDPASALVSYRTERELKRTNRGVLIPDGWIHIRRQWPGRDRPNQHYIAWELDRGTIKQRAFRKKITALVEWVERGYTQQFGVTGLTIAFVVESGPTRRLEEIFRWAEAELNDSHLKHYADLFLFARFDPAKAKPATVFHQPIWRVPFTRELVSLLQEPYSSSESSNS